MATVSHQKQASTQPGGLHTFLEHVGWVVTVALGWVWLANSYGNGFHGVVVYFSVISLLYGGRIFATHGGSFITATGLFNLSSAMFVGFSGLLLVNDGSLPTSLRYLAMAVAASVTAQIFSTILATRGALPEPAMNLQNTAGFTRRRRLRGGWLQHRDAHWVTNIALLFLAIAVIGNIIEPPGLQRYVESTAFAAICLLAAGVISRADAKLFSFGTLVVFGSVALYAQWFHAGSGRLRMVALACAIGVLYAARFRKRGLKTLTLVVLPLALFWLAQNRLAHQESLSVGASEGRTGLESMLASMKVFAELIHAVTQRGFSLSYGENLLSVPAIFIPNSLWPDAPRALGYELVRISAPARYSPDSDYSVVASSTGEAFYHVGWWGIPVIVLVVGLGLRVLDRLVLRYGNLVNTTVPVVLIFTVVAICVGSVADYTWSGLHTYVARLTTRAPVFVAVAVLAGLRSAMIGRHHRRHQQFHSGMDIPGRLKIKE